MFDLESDRNSKLPILCRSQDSSIAQGFPAQEVWLTLILVRSPSEFPVLGVNTNNQKKVFLISDETIKFGFKIFHCQYRGSRSDGLYRCVNHLSRKNNILSSLYLFKLRQRKSIWLMYYSQKWLYTIVDWCRISLYYWFSCVKAECLLRNISKEKSTSDI